MNKLYWIVALATLVLMLLALTYWALLPRRKVQPLLPNDWALTARPVFNTNERLAYRLLSEALPQHIVLSKLALVRFCQPVDATQTRYWYDLLGAAHVGFAICSANGRVLAAIDLELDRGPSHRANEIKKSVLAACRVRYLRCPPNQLPSIDELHMLVPQQAGTALFSTPQATRTHRSLTEARESLVSAVASRRAQRTSLWQESHSFQDSFFAPDSRLDSLGGFDFPATTESIDSQNVERAGRSGDDDALDGVVARTEPRRPQLRGPEGLRIRPR